MHGQTSLPSVAYDYLPQPSAVRQDTGFNVIHRQSTGEGQPQRRANFPRTQIFYTIINIALLICKSFSRCCVGKFFIYLFLASSIKLDYNLLGNRAVCLDLILQISILYGGKLLEWRIIYSTKIFIFTNVSGKGFLF